MACIRLGEEVFDEAHADVVAHAVELGVDGCVVGFGAAGWEGEVAAEGCDDGAVGEGDDFGVDFVDAGSWGMSAIVALFRRVSWLRCLLPYSAQLSAQLFTMCVPDMFDGWLTLRPDGRTWSRPCLLFMWARCTVARERTIFSSSLAVRVQAQV